MNLEGSAINEMENSVSFSNLPPNVTNNVKSGKAMLVTPSFPNKFSCNTHDASKSMKTECDPAPLLKSVKVEGLPKLDNLPKASTSQPRVSFNRKAKRIGLSLYGIKPCWVVLERLDINKVDDTISMVNEVMPFSKTFANNNMTDDLVHDNMTGANLIAPIVPYCCIKTEKEEETFSPPLSCEMYRASNDDNKMSNNVIRDNNDVKRETRHLVAPFVPDCRIKVEKESSSLSLSDESMICDNNILDNNVKDEASFLVAPLVPYCKKEEECFSLPSSSNAFHDNEMYDNMFCDNKDHANNPIKSGISLAAPLVPDCLIKSEKENYPSLLSSTETYHDNHMHEKMICDINAVKRETFLLVAPFIPANRIKVEKEEECSSFLPFPKLCNDSNDNICDSNSVKREIFPLVAPFPPDCLTKIEKEECSDFPFSSEVCSDNNTICDIKIHVNNPVECETSLPVGALRTDNCTEAESVGEYFGLPSFSNSKDFHNNRTHNIRDMSSSTPGFRCERCSTSFTRKDNLRSHIKYHCNSSSASIAKKVCPPAVTDTCHGYINRNSKRTDGLEEIRPQCKDCGKYFSRPDTLKKHFKRKHFSPKSKAVLAVSKRIVKKSNLAERKHARPKGNTSASSDALKKHVKSAPLRSKSKTKVTPDALQKQLKRALSRSKNETNSTSNTVSIYEKEVVSDLDKGLQKMPLRPEGSIETSQSELPMPEGKTEHDIGVSLSPEGETHNKSGIMFDCDHCEKSFLTKNARQCHKSYHRKKFELKRVCNVCSASFGDSYTFNHHMRWGHRAPAPVVVKIGKCEGCDTVFSRFGDLKRHLKRPGINNDNFFALIPSEAFDCSTCRFCQKVFSKEGFLKCHLLRRFQKQAQVCQLCCVYFEDPEDLSKHLGEVHQICNIPAVGGKPKGIVDYTCDQCGKSFKRKGFLKMHILQRCFLVEGSDINQK